MTQEPGGFWLQENKYQVMPQHQHQALVAADYWLAFLVAELLRPRLLVPLQVV